MFSLPATLPNLQLFFPRFLFPSRAPPPISTVFGEVKAAVFNGCPKLSELAKCEYEPEQSWCETTEVRCKQQSGESVTDGSLKSTFSPYFFLSLSLSLSLLKRLHMNPWRYRLLQCTCLASTHPKHRQYPCQCCRACDGFPPLLGSTISRRIW